MKTVGSAPFALLTYADVRLRARQIVAAVSSRSMPPWKPEPGYGDCADARRLSDSRVQTIVNRDPAARAHAFDVLAAALAAAGRFDAAVAAAQTALTVLRPEERASLEPAIGQRIQLHRAGRAYRLTTP